MVVSKWPGLAGRPKPSDSPLKSGGNNVSLDWDRRDIELAHAVEVCAAELSARDDWKRIKLWELYQRIPELNAKLGNVARLPLTAAAIHAALGRKPVAPFGFPLAP